MTESVLVIKPNQDLEIRSNTPFQKDDICQFNQDTYNVLERKSLKVASKHTSQSLQSHHTTSYEIRSQSGLIQKIHLVDFPPGQYFLQFNHSNVATAKLENGQYVFDLGHENRSNQLDQYSSLTLTSGCEIVPDRSKYINISRIDKIHILTPNPLNEKMCIKFEGLFRDNQHQWTFSNDACYTIYPNEVDFNLRHMVRRMILSSSTNNEIYIRIAGKIYGPVKLNPTGQIIEFEGWNIITSIQSKYIKNVSQCIPLNRMRELSIIPISDSERVNVEIAAFVYTTYHMSTCLPLFSC